MYSVIPRATTKKAVQSDILKSTESEERIQKCSWNSQEGNKRETEEQRTEETKRKQIIKWHTETLAYL